MKADERDNQFCDVVVLSDADITHVAMSADGSMGLGGTAKRNPCNEKLERIEISMVQRGKVDVRYKTKAILTDGRKVEGQFGRSERINKGSM